MELNLDIGTIIMVFCLYGVWTFSKDIGHLICDVILKVWKANNAKEKSEPDQSVPSIQHYHAIFAGSWYCDIHKMFLVDKDKITGTIKT